MKTRFPISSSFLARHKAASLTGYGLVVGLIAILAIVAVKDVGNSVNDLFVVVDGELTEVASGTGSGSSGGSSNGASGSSSGGDIPCTADQDIILSTIGEATGSVTVPSGCESVTIEVWGAGGASGHVTVGSASTLGGSGGVGGYAQGSMTALTGSESFSYSIGTQGFTPLSAGPPVQGVGGTSSLGYGGGNGETGPAQAAGGGAAAAVVRLDGTDLIVAGGGGGGGSSWPSGTNPVGGVGGGNSAGDGVTLSNTTGGIGGVYNTGSESCTAGSGTTQGGTGTSGGGSFGAGGGGGGGICGGGATPAGEQSGGGGGAGLVDTTRLEAGASTTTRSVDGSNVPNSDLPSGAAVISALSGEGLAPSDIGRGGVSPGIDQGEDGQVGLIVFTWAD